MIRNYCERIDATDVAWSVGRNETLGRVIVRLERFGLNGNDAYSRANITPAAAEKLIAALARTALLAETGADGIPEPEMSGDGVWTLGVGSDRTVLFSLTDEMVVPGAVTTLALSRGDVLAVIGELAHAMVEIRRSWAAARTK
jgi:hypothetical protein